MIALTIAVGFAAWYWAEGAAANSESNFGSAIATNLNYLKESFEVVYVNFSSSHPSNASVWVYNNGNNTVYIKQIWIYNSSGLSQTFTNLNSTVTTKFNCNCIVIDSGSIATVTLTLTSATFESGYVYAFEALGEYGNTNTLDQTR